MKKDTKGSANVRSPRPVRNSPVNSPAEMQTILDNVATNPAKVEFPRDIWGFTSGLKKEALRAASAINGQPDKQELFLNTLKVIVKHVEARFSVDENFKKDLTAQKLAKATVRLDRARVFGMKPAKPPEQEAKVNG